MFEAAYVAAKERVTSSDENPIFRRTFEIRYGLFPCAFENSDKNDLMHEIEINTDTIRLGQFLKLSNLVDSGSDAKFLLAEGEVSVNGEVETRRGRQLRAGDIVEFEGTEVRVVSQD